METSLVRPIDADDTLRRPTSDLLKIDEANHLFNSFQPRLPSSIATPFLVYPLLQALLACFPPKIDLCMSIYRQMRPASQESHLNFLRHLSIFAKDSVRPPAAEGPDRETLVLLLGWLSKHDFYRDRSKDHLVAIVEDLVKDRRECCLVRRGPRRDAVVGIGHLGHFLPRLSCRHDLHRDTLARCESKHGLAGAFASA